MIRGVEPRAAAALCLLSIAALQFAGCGTTGSTNVAASPVVGIADDGVRDAYRDASRRHSRDESDLEAARDLGIAQVRLGQYRQAAETLREARSGYPSDPFLWTYEGLALEMLGDAASASERYVAAAAEGEPGFDTVGARAAVLEARQVTTARGSTGLPTVVVLRPKDLLDSGVETPDVIATCLGVELVRSGKVRVMPAKEAVVVLGKKGASASDLDDPERERLARAVLRDAGVDWLVRVSFLQEGGVQYRGSIDELSTGDARSILDDVAEAGRELAPLRLAAGKVLEAITGQPSETPGVIPSKLEAGSFLTAGIAQFESGSLSAAVDRFRRGVRIEDAPELQRWLTLSQHLQELENPVVATDEDPGRIVAYLRDLGQAPGAESPAPTIPDLTL